VQLEPLCTKKRKTEKKTQTGEKYASREQKNARLKKKTQNGKSRRKPVKKTQTGEKDAKQQKNTQNR